MNENNGIIIKNDNIEDLLSAMTYIYEQYDKYDPVKISQNIIGKFGEKAFINMLLPIYYETCK